MAKAVKLAKPSKQTIIDAIIKGIEQGKDRGDLLATVGKKWQLSQRTFDRHWKTANEQHTDKQQKIKEALAEVDKQAAIDARKKAIMTADERKEYLTQLITGNVKIPYTEVRWNPKTQRFNKIKFVELASHTARIGAISELNKMEGDYAPTKIANTNKDGEDIAGQVMLTLPPGITLGLLPSNTEGEDEQE